MNKRRLFYLLFGGLMVAQLQAQDPSVQAPVPPENASWTITFKILKPAGLPQSGSAPSPSDTTSDELKSVSYTKTGDLGRAEFHYSKSVKVYYDSKGLQMGPSDHGTLQREANPDENVSELLRYMVLYPGFDWVGPSYFVGVERRGQIECLHYRLGPAAAPGQPTTEAWVSAATHLPIAYITGPLSGEYEFGSPPTSPITLPPEAESIVKRYNTPPP